MIQANEQVVRNVVQEVLAQLGRRTNGSTNASSHSNGDWGVFQTVDQCVQAAGDGFQKLKAASMEDRAIAIQCVRSICTDQADELGRLEMEETKIGRLDHKIEKLKIVKLVPGIEFLRCDSLSGDHGMSVTEYAPFGVIGVITPVTHSLPTLAGNVVNMVAAGNTLVVNPHPSGARIACEGVRRFNRAIYEATGLENLVTIVSEPTLETAGEVFAHRGVRLLVATGGPGVARAALASKKRAIVAGPGNPPVMVDETADLENAAASIVKGAAYDNNLLCIAEKEVFVVNSVFDTLMDAMSRNGAFRLDAQQTQRLTELAFAPPEQPGGHPVLNRDFIGADPSKLAEQIGVSVPADTQILYAETDTSNPFVPEEQMMPFVPFVRVKDAAEGIAMCKEFEHGFGHTAIVHSRNVRTMTTMGREMDTTVFVMNGPCMAGLGLGGEGYLSYSIATPTGEGVTNPMTFTRQRRCAMIDDLRFI